MSDVRCQRSDVRGQGSERRGAIYRALFGLTRRREATKKKSPLLKLSIYHISNVIILVGRKPPSRSGRAFQEHNKGFHPRRHMQLSQQIRLTCQARHPYFSARGSIENKIFYLKSRGYST